MAPRRRSPRRAPHADTPARRDVAAALDSLADLHLPPLLPSADFPDPWAETRGMRLWATTQQALQSLEDGLAVEIGLPDHERDHVMTLVEHAVYKIVRAVRRRLAPARAGTGRPPGKVGPLMQLLLDAVEDDALPLSSDISDLTLVEARDPIKTYLQTLEPDKKGATPHPVEVDDKHTIVIVSVQDQRHTTSRPSRPDTRIRWTDNDKRHETWLATLAKDLVRHLKLKRERRPRRRRSPPPA